MSWWQRIFGTKKDLAKETNRLLDTIAFRLEEQNTILLSMVSQNRLLVDHKQSESATQYTLATNGDTKVVFTGIPLDMYEAMKKWVDTSTLSVQKLSDVNERLNNRERELLRRWKEQVETMEQHIAMLRVENESLKYGRMAQT